VTRRGDEVERDGRGSDLTPCELRILCGIVEGAGDHSIAARLSLPVATIKRHIREIHRKLFLRRQDTVAASGPVERELFAAPGLRDLVAMEIERRFVEAVAESLREAATSRSASQTATRTRYRQRLADIDAEIGALRAQTASQRNRLVARVVECVEGQAGASELAALRTGPEKAMALRKFVCALADLVLAPPGTPEDPARDAAILGYVREMVAVEVAHRRRACDLDRKRAELTGE